MTLQELFNTVKNIENNQVFPIPTPEATVNVGTLDAVTGEFVFSDSIDHRRVTERIDGLPHPESVTFIESFAPVGSIKVSLQFGVINRQGAFEVIANDEKVVAAPDQDSIVINVGKAESVNFTVRCGETTCDDELTIDRSQVFATGAFLIPALPVCIIYSAPQGQLKANTVDYSDVTTVGTRVKLSYESEDSVTTSDFVTFQNFLNKSAGIVTAFGDLKSSFTSISDTAKNGIKGFKAITELFSLFFGSDDFKQSAANSRVSGSNLDTFDSTEFKTASVAGLDPGPGDRFILLRNVRLAWVADYQGVSVAFLGADERSGVSVRALLDDLTGETPGLTRLDADTIRAMLRLDPFIGNVDALAEQPRFTLPRFVPVRLQTGEFIFSGIDTNGDSIQWKHDVTSTDIATTKSSQTEIREQSPGFLSFLGIGSDVSKTTKTSFTFSSSTERVEGQSVTVKVNFKTTSDEEYRIRAFYDRLFGSFVFQPIVVPISEL
jgi:hypothetical protein